MFFVQALAKEKAKSYEFRSETTSRSPMAVSYPSPEPVITPRAREGLRAVVPTIFPPSTVNRGESVRVRPPEPQHRLPSPPPPPPPSSALSRTMGDPFQQRIPKKRGPKPKLRFKDGLLCAGGPLSRESRSQEPLGYSSSSISSPSKLLKPSILGESLERDSDGRMMKLGHHGHHHNHHPHRPFHSATCYPTKSQMRLGSGGGTKPPHHHHHHHNHHHHHSSMNSHSHPQRSGLDGHGHHRTKSYLLHHHHSPLHLKHLAHSSNPFQKKKKKKREEDAPLFPQPPAAGTTLCQPGLLAKVPAVPPQVPGQTEEDLSSWRPPLGNLEKVVVTDVTTNFLTVTIKESTTDKGFFKEKR